MLEPANKGILNRGMYAFCEYKKRIKGSVLRVWKTVMKPSKHLTCESACAQTVCVYVCVCARSCFCLLDIMKLSKRLTTSKAQKVLAFPRDKWDQGSIAVILSDKATDLPC